MNNGVCVNLNLPLNYFSISVDRLFYMGYFGGVSAVSKDQYKRINGASNVFWGWGGEDDDFYKR
jgi:predicted glycosyltransferase involved in capsule biosynthesis